MGTGTAEMAWLLSLGGGVLASWGLPRRRAGRVEVLGGGARRS